MYKQILICLLYLSVFLVIENCSDDKKKSKSNSNSNSNTDTGQSETVSLEPGAEIEIDTSSGEAITATLLDADNDGQTDGIDFDGDGISDVDLLATDDSATALGFDADSDGIADYFLVIVDGAIDLNTAVDGSGQSAVLIVADGGDVTGVDSDGDGDSDTDITDEEENTASVPTFDPEAGSVAINSTVTATTTTSDATIYYTTGDGTQADPECGSGLSGTEGDSSVDLTISADTTVKTIACHSELDASAIVEAAYTIFTITSVTPDNGLASATAAVVITGTGFTSSNDATANGNDATCTFQNSTTLSCTLPANSSTVETVDVELNHSNGTATTLSDGFTYTGVLADPGPNLWCGIQSPASTSTTVGVATALIYGQVYINGVTEAAGAGAGIVAQLGYGSDGTSPEAANFTWVDTAFNVNVGNNDEYEATLTINSTGSYDYAYRFTQDSGLNYYYCDTVGGGGSDDGYSTANAGDLTVNP